MILLDANLLIYSVNSDAPLYQQAKEWVETTLAGQRGPVALSWFNLVAFVRIITNPKIMTAPRSLDEALNQVNSWLLLPAVTLISPGLNHARHLKPSAGPQTRKATL